jgi:hypothetical protein
MRKELRQNKDNKLHAGRMKERAGGVGGEITNEGSRSKLFQRTDEPHPD